MFNQEYRRQRYRSNITNRQKSTSRNKSFSSNNQSHNESFDHMNIQTPIIDYQLMTRKLNKELGHRRLSDLPIQCFPIIDILDKRPIQHYSQRTRSYSNLRSESSLNKYTMKSMRNLQLKIKEHQCKELSEYCLRLCDYLEKHKIDSKYRSNGTIAKKQTKLDQVLKILGDKIHNKYTNKTISHKPVDTKTDNSMLDLKSIELSTNNILKGYFNTLVNYLTGIITDNISDSCEFLISNKIWKQNLKSKSRICYHHSVNNKVLKASIKNGSGDFKDCLTKRSDDTTELEKTKLKNGKTSTLQGVDSLSLMNDQILSQHLYKSNASVLIHRMIKCAMYIPCKQEPFIYYDFHYDSHLTYSSKKTIEQFPVILKLSSIDFIQPLSSSSINDKMETFTYKWDISSIIRTSKDIVKTIHTNMLNTNQNVAFPLFAYQFSSPLTFKSVNIKRPSITKVSYAQQSSCIDDATSMATCFDSDSYCSPFNIDKNDKSVGAKCVSSSLDNNQIVDNTNSTLMSLPAVPLYEKSKPTTKNDDDLLSLSEITSILSKSSKPIESFCSLEKLISKFEEESFYNIQSNDSLNSLATAAVIDEVEEVHVDRMINFSKNDNNGHQVTILSSALTRNDNDNDCNRIPPRTVELKHIDDDTFIARNYLKKIGKILSLPWFYHNNISLI